MKTKQDKETAFDNLKQQRKVNGRTPDANNTGNVLQQTIIINSSNFNIHCNQKQQNNSSLATAADTRNTNQPQSCNINDNSSIASQFFSSQLTPSHHQQNRSKSSNTALKTTAMTSSKHSRQNQQISPFKSASPKPQQSALSLLQKRQKSTPNSNILNVNRQIIVPQAENSAEVNVNQVGVGRFQSPILALPDKQKITINDANNTSGLKDKQNHILRQVDNLQRHENQAKQLEFQSFLTQPHNNDNNFTFNPQNFNSRFTFKKPPLLSEILQQQTQQQSTSNRNVKGCNNVGPSYDILLQKLANSKPVNEDKSDSTKIKTNQRSSLKQQPRDIQVFPYQPYQMKNKQNEHLGYIQRFIKVSSDPHMESNQNANNSSSPQTGNQKKQINPEKSLLHSILNKQSNTLNPSNNPIIRFKNNTIDVNTTCTKKIRTSSSGLRRKSPSVIPRSNSQHSRRPDSSQQQCRLIEKQQYPPQSQHQKQFEVLEADQSRKNSGIHGSLKRFDQQSNRVIPSLEESQNNKQAQLLNNIISPYLNPRSVVSQSSKKRITNMDKPDQPCLSGTTLPMQLECQNNNYRDIMKIYNDTNLSKLTGNTENTKLHRRYKSNIRGTDIRAKTEMDYEGNVDATADRSLSESLNILNQFNDLDAQASSKQLLLCQNKDSTNINSNTPLNSKDISKTIDESVKLYLNESDFIASSGIRTQQDLESNKQAEFHQNNQKQTDFMKSGLKLVQKDIQIKQHQPKNANHLQQQNTNKAPPQRKHSASVYSVLKENHHQAMTKTSKIHDYFYDFDLDG